MITPFQIGLETARLVRDGRLSVYAYPKLPDWSLHDVRGFVQGERAFDETTSITHAAKEAK